MSQNHPTATEERKIAGAILSAGVTASLKPQLGDQLRVALTVKQNFALAAEQIFTHALARTVWVYRDQYQVVELIMAEIRNTAFESLGTDPGIARVSDLVFGDGAIREFLFTLQVQFFSQFTEFNNLWTELIHNIAMGLTNDFTTSEAKKEMSLVPEEISLRTHSSKHMKDLMLANNWLVMFIFIALWGKTYTYDELRYNQRRSLTIAANNNSGS